jgi:uncharacterized membrane protein YjgN (DUF898 family)
MNSLLDRFICLYLFLHVASKLVQTVERKDILKSTLFLGVVVCSPLVTSHKMVFFMVTAVRISVSIKGIFCSFP